MGFPKTFFYSRPHPWHGLSVGDRCPEFVESYIEITPYDEIKYEVDKVTGYLRVDRPQITASLPPALYGFVPRTYCGERVRALTPEARVGDGDPLDICVISDRPVTKTDIILSAKVIGGFQMIDGDEADDKILAIIEKDRVWGEISDISELPKILVERLRHYFMTYKQLLGQENHIKVDVVYGREHAFKVIEAAIADYEEAFGKLMKAHRMSNSELISLVAAD
ncbi:MAG: inorganic pyrophosphatase [Chloroflexota bacterium]